jgi:hypothetical protein
MDNNKTSETAMTEERESSLGDKSNADRGLMDTGFGIAVLGCTVVLSFLFGDAFNTFGIGYLMGQWVIALGLALPVFIVIRYLTKWGRKATKLQTVNILFLALASVFVLYAVIRTIVPNQIANLQSAKSISPIAASQVAELQTAESPAPVSAPSSTGLDANGEPVVDAKWSYMGAIKNIKSKDDTPRYFYCDKSSITLGRGGGTISCLVVEFFGWPVPLRRESLIDVDCVKDRWRESFDGKMFDEWEETKHWETMIKTSKEPDMNTTVKQIAQMVRARVQAVCSPSWK